MDLGSSKTRSSHIRPWFDRRLRARTLGRSVHGTIYPFLNRYFDVGVLRLPSLVLVPDITGFTRTPNVDIPIALGSRTNVFALFEMMVILESTRFETL